MTAARAAIIPAAGLGTRLAGTGSTPTYPKAVRLLAGRSLLRRSAEVLAPSVDLLVVATPTGRSDDVRRELSDLPCRVETVHGGSTRQQSVHRALRLVTSDIDHVLVHDAARPLVPAAVVDRVLEALTGGAVAVVPVLPVADTLRIVHDTGSGPLDRATVRAVQTPQGFVRQALVDAHARAQAGDATDDATLVERLGHRVVLVDGDPLGFKITTAVDLQLAEALAR